jgi:hypothetical protein
VALSAPGHLVLRQVSCPSELLSCESVLFVHPGVTAVRDRPILPHGLPHVFKSSQLLLYVGARSTAVSGLSATPGSLASQCLWPCWFPPGLSSLGTSFLQRRPSGSLGCGGRSQPSPFSLTGSRALSRAAIYTYVPDSSATCSSLQVTSENVAFQCLWPSWFRQVSPTFGTFFLRRGPFCSLRRGGCSQPSHSPSRGPERFRERSSLFLHLPGLVASYGLQATPESLAPQCLWPSFFRARSLALSELSPRREVLFVHSGVAVVRNRLFHPCGSRSFSRASFSIFLAGGLGGFLRFASYP